MSHVMAMHRRPSFASCGMVVEKRCVKMEEAAKATAFPHWLTLDMPAPVDDVYRAKKVSVSLFANPYHAARRPNRSFTTLSEPGSYLRRKRPAASSHW
jgi:hypothetical protein